MFDGNSFKKIKRAKIGGESFRDKLTAVWFELMDFAGKCNAGGQLVESPEIPFSNLEDIAVMIDREPEELNLCMQYYINNRMITVIDDIYLLTNWAKYQNEDGLGRIREQTRKRVAKHREKQKMLVGNVTCNVTVTECNATEEEEENRKEIIDTERKNERKKAPHSIDQSPGDENISEDHQLNRLNGKLGKGVVLLSEAQIADLLEKLSLDEYHKYVEIVADAELNGKHYKRKSHYQAILDMAKADRAVSV